MKYLHDLQIVHGDLKGVCVPLVLSSRAPNSFAKANILINRDKRACIADFGVVTFTSVPTSVAARASVESLASLDSLMSFTAGETYRWMSPELMYPDFFGIPPSEGTRPTTKSDCYAFGMVIYEVGVSVT